MHVELVDVADASKTKSKGLLGSLAPHGALLIYHPMTICSLVNMNLRERLDTCAAFPALMTKFPTKKQKVQIFDRNDCVLKNVGTSSLPASGSDRATFIKFHNQSLSVYSKCCIDLTAKENDSIQSCTLHLHEEKEPPRTDDWINCDSNSDSDIEIVGFSSSVKDRCSVKLHMSEEIVLFEINVNNHLNIKTSMLEVGQLSEHSISHHLSPHSIVKNLSQDKKNKISSICFPASKHLYHPTRRTETCPYAPIHSAPVMKTTQISRKQLCYKCLQRRLIAIHEELAALDKEFFDANEANNVLQVQNLEQHIEKLIEECDLIEERIDKDKKKLKFERSHACNIELTDLEDFSESEEEAGTFKNEQVISSNFPGRQTLLRRIELLQQRFVPDMDKENVAFQQASTTLECTKKLGRPMFENRFVSTNEHQDFSIVNPIPPTEHHNNATVTMTTILQPRRK